MYFSGKTEFGRKVGRVKEILESEEASKEGPLFVIEPIGDAISAESRQTYRVSTISADLEATVGEEENLQVQDLSSTGFAVVASMEYQIGQTIEVSIAHGEDHCHGIASVQSVRSLGVDRIRYGLRAIEEDPHTGEFLQVLQRISLAVQREQLKRSGGAA